MLHCRLEYLVKYHGSVRVGPDGRAPQVAVGINGVLAQASHQIQARALLLLLSSPASVACACLVWCMGGWDGRVRRVQDVVLDLGEGEVAMFAPATPAADAARKLLGRFSYTLISVCGRRNVHEKYFAFIVGCAHRSPFYCYCTVH